MFVLFPLRSIFSKKHSDIIPSSLREVHKTYNSQFPLAFNYFEEVTMSQLLELTSIEWNIETGINVLSTTGKLLDTLEKLQNAVDDGTMPPGLGVCQVNDDNTTHWMLYHFNEEECFKYYFLEENE